MAGCWVVKRRVNGAAFCAAVDATYVDEELASARVGTTRVGHRKRTGLITKLSAVEELILDVSMRRTACSRHWALGILGVRATKLEHEIGDHTVKVEAIVKT